MVELRRIDVWTFSKVIAVISFVLCTIFFIILGAIEWGLNEELLRAQGYRILTYLGVMVALVAFYTLLAFAFAALAAWLYNRFSDRFGGVEIELSERRKR